MYTSTSSASVRVWDPSPDHDAAHSWFLDKLTRMQVPFRSPPPVSVSNRVKGNIGECLCMHIARLPGGFNLLAFAANASQPFSEMSRADMDIVWAHLDDSDPSNDFVVLQEVKTTGADNASISDKLVGDYEKLFSTSVDLTLATRLAEVANRLEYERVDVDLRHVDTIRSLAGSSPQSSHAVSLLPSLIYDPKKCPNPNAKLVAVRQAIVAFGWDPAAVEMWQVALDHLDDRLARLRVGKL